MPQAIRGRLLVPEGRFNPTPAHVGFAPEGMALGPGFSLGTLFLILLVLDALMCYSSTTEGILV
jgi:hypothetical protein